MGELAAFGTAVCWSFTAIFFGFAGRRVGSDVVNRTRLLFALLFISATHLALEGSIFPFATEPWRWGWLTASSIVGLIIGDALLFHSYTLISPRLSMLIMALVPVLSALAGWLLFGEFLLPRETVAMFIAIAGVGWVVTDGDPSPNPPERSQFIRGLLFAFGGAVGQTGNLVLSKYALVDGYSALSATLVRILVGVVAMWGWAIVRGQARPLVRKLRLDRPATGAVIGGAIVGPFLGIWFSLIAVQLARLGIASTIMALPPVILIPLTAIFFRDRMSWRGAAGTVVAFGGVALLLLNP